MSNPAWCSILTWTGFGSNYCCLGCLCCAPEYVKEYSRLKGGKTTLEDALNTAVEDPK